MNDTQGRKEIAENVAQAVLIAAATALVNLAVKTIEAKLEKREKNNNAA